MSPEQYTRLQEYRARKRVLTEINPFKDDIWALGQTFYEMCTFQRISNKNTLNLKPKIDEMRQKMGIYPPELFELFKCMLETNMEERIEIHRVFNVLSSISSNITTPRTFVLKRQDKIYEEAKQNVDETTVEESYAPHQYKIHLQLPPNHIPSKIGR